MLNILLTLIFFISLNNLYVDSQNVAGQFDYYVFAYSWTPEFCYGNTATYPGCNNPQEFWGKYFTIHGLWPQYSNGGYPSFCSTEIFDSSVPNQIGNHTWPPIYIFLLILSYKINKKISRIMFFCYFFKLYTDVFSIGMSTMTQYWPNVQAEETSPNYDDFWQHEWDKHGKNMMIIIIFFFKFYND